MQGPSAGGGSPEREAGAGERPRGPGRGRRVRFLMPHTTTAVPSGREEEQLFYRRLDGLAALGPAGFTPLFAAEGWSDLTGECPGAASRGREPRTGRRCPGAALTGHLPQRTGCCGSAWCGTGRAARRRGRARRCR